MSLRIITSSIVLFSVFFSSIFSVYAGGANYWKMKQRLEDSKQVENTNEVTEVESENIEVSNDGEIIIVELEDKDIDKLNQYMNDFTKNIENLSSSEKINQHTSLNDKIDKVEKTYMDSDISEGKKEAYKNLFESIRSLNNQIIDSLK